MSLRVVFSALLQLNFLLFAYTAPEIKLGSTTLVGDHLGESNVDFFGGIPFAEPPLGPLRLRPPVLKVRLNGTSFNATTYGKVCLQPSVPPILLPPGETPFLETSEDCLTINIHRPSGIKKGTGLPVLFWTYGGAFIIGGATAYNGSELVRYSVERGTPIVYVSFNYRLGPLAYPQGQEADDNHILNLALHDQLAALKWVRTNIHHFGGDKDKVTIFGESAGAIMTGLQYFNTELARLARGAILQSGSPTSFPGFRAADKQSSWEQFVRGVPSCAFLASSNNTLECLRNASSSEIETGLLRSTSILNATTWTPVLDSSHDSLLPDLPSKLYAQGRFARLPFIAGTNLDEGTLFSTAARSPNFTAEFLKIAITASVSPPLVGTIEALRETVNRIVDSYPDDPALGSPFNTGTELFGLPEIYKRHAATVGDMTFVAPRRMWSQAAAEFGVKTYGYLFTQPQPLDEPSLGVYHAAENPFVYGSPRDTSASARRLSTVIMDYWISFTVNLDPNDSFGNKRPTWPRFTRSDQVLLELNGINTTAIKDNFRDTQITLINANAYTLRR